MHVEAERAAVELRGADVHEVPDRPLARNVVDAVEALGKSAGAAETASGKVRLSLPAPLGLYISDRLASLFDRHPELSLDLLFREEPSDLVEDGIDLEVRLG